jgi:CRP-like cAMP-binding protein
MGMLRMFGQTELLFGLGGRREKVICVTDCRLMRIKEQALLRIFSHKDSLLKCLHFLNVNTYFEVLYVLLSNSQSWRRCS